MSDVPISYLKRIGNRYYFQKRVPLDLTSAYPGKLVKRALGTADYEAAKRKLAVELVKLEKEFAEKPRAAAASNADQRRLPCDIQDLKVIFTSPVFGQG